MRTTAQIALTFTAPSGPTPRDHNARWLALVASRPDIGARVLAYCRGERAAGRSRISIAKCWESLRGTVGMPLDNSLRAPASRWVVAQDPKLESYIEMRRMRAA